jgi:uncharacterized sulfatase
VEYSDITPTMIDIAGGKPVKGLDGSSLVPLLREEKNEHKKYTYGMMTTRGIFNGSEYYPIRTVSNGTYRYILNLAPEAEFSDMAAMPGWEEAAKTDPAAATLVQKHKFRPAVELYNDRDDPYNQQNLAGLDPYRKIRKKLDKQLKKWMVYVGDKGLVTELQAFEHMQRGNGDGLTLLTEFADPVQTGNLEVPVRGYYSFYISGEGSIYLDEQLIVKGLQAEGENAVTRYGIIALEAGWHKAELISDDPDARLQWSGPGLMQTPLLLKK